MPINTRPISNISISGSGITESEHRALDQLVHLIAENSYIEIVKSSGKISDIIIWTDSGKTTKIRETNITRTSGKVSQIVIKQYNSSGTLSETYTQTLTRTSGKVTSIDGVLT